MKLNLHADNKDFKNSSLPVVMQANLYIVGAVFHRHARHGSPEILAFQRAGGDLGAGKWEFPGGKIEDGETPAVALSREIHEELGVSIEILTDLGTVLESHQGFRVFTFPSRKIFLRLFTVHPAHWQFQLSDHQALVWVNKGQASKLDWLDADRPWLEDVFDFLRGQKIE